MKIKYQTIALRTKSLEIIKQANWIIEEYQAAGYALTLRQLFYQFVSRDLFANTVQNYDRLGCIISQGRRAGLVDWDAIVDHTRFLRRDPTWTKPEDILESCAKQFRLNLWSSQSVYVELWFEKDALLAVFQRAAESWRVPLCSNRGYMSDSAVWEAAQRFLVTEKQGIGGVVLHFGDHDPSGIDMTRDLEERLQLFGVSPEVKRVALNMNQVRQYKPPSNPAKESDCRFEGYRRKYGDKSWELDALSPDVMCKLVESEVAKLVDLKPWKKMLKLETQHRKELARLPEHYATICRWLDEQDEKP